MYAKYTVVLKDLLDNTETKALIDKAMSTYPIYTPTSKNEYIPNVIPTREELNRKILNHYKYREIGFETVGRFVDELEITMNEIMPLYNQLMFTQDQDYNIIYNVDYKRTIDTEKNGEVENTSSGTAKTTSEGTGNTTASNESNTTASDTSSATSENSSTTNSTDTKYNKSVSTDTPANELNITAENIDVVPYADNVKWNKDSDTSNSTNNSEGTTETSGNSTSKTIGEGTTTTTNSDEQNVTSSSENTGKSKDTEKTLETTKGNFGVVSAQDLVQKYREIIINIEQMIINDVRVQELFMLVY